MLITYTHDLCDALRTDHEHPVVRELAKQLMAVHEAVREHLVRDGLDSETGGAALDIPLLVADRELHEECPECAEGSPDEACNTCLDTIWAGADDR